MNPFNTIEFYDKSFKVIHQDVIDDIEIDEDYLAPENTTIPITYTDKVVKGQFVYIYGTVEFFGIVDSVKAEESGMTVDVKPFISLFDHDIMFDTSLQNSETSLEETLKNYIEEYWISSYDPLRNLEWVTVEIPESQYRTTNWSFDFESGSEDLHRCVIGFHSELICRALKEYGVGIKCKFDLNTAQLNIYISTWNKTNAAKLIDANLMGVTVKTFEVDQINKDVNCLEIWNDNAKFEEDSRIVYCLRKDGTYNYIDIVTEEERVLPVRLSVRTVTVEGMTNFRTAAAQEARREFANAVWNSLIELEVGSTDTLVDPVNMMVGTMVRIDYKGRVYESILTGKKLSSAVTLVFGMVRADYTKQMKIRW